MKTVLTGLGSLPGLLQPGGIHAFLPGVEEGEMGNSDHRFLLLFQISSTGKAGFHHSLDEIHSSSEIAQSCLIPCDSMDYM